jgi:hypothetical protein
MSSREKEGITVAEIRQRLLSLALDGLSAKREVEEGKGKGNGKEEKTADKTGQATTKYSHLLQRSGVQRMKMMMDREMLLGKGSADIRISGGRACMNVVHKDLEEQVVAADERAQT